MIIKGYRCRGCVKMCMSLCTWEVLSIPPMSGIYPHSIISVNNEGALRLDFTAIYVAVAVGGCSHPNPVIHGRRRGYQLHRRQTQYRM